MRTRNVDIILYDRENIENMIDICLANSLEYAYIYHDKDIEEKTGELKKAHFHFRVFSDLQKSTSAWSKLFNVSENYVEKLDDKRLSIRYLIHLDNAEKYQYNQNEIVSNIEDINKYFQDNKQEESKQLKDIMNYIDNIMGYIYFNDVKNFILKNGYWSSYRRYYSIIRDLIIEKNRYKVDLMLN